MDFRTIVDIPAAEWKIPPCEKMLFVGSCFADNLGHRFQEEQFRAVVNPYGVMYNPASILHTIERLTGGETTEAGNDFSGFVPNVVVMTLGTNHVYILNETGEIVDNCQKRPQRLFTEKELSVDECCGYLRKAAETLRKANPGVRIIITVSPIRYRKYGYHGSQLSKAVLQLAVRKFIETDDDGEKTCAQECRAEYFPAYEIVLDELRDYRFYKEDMLHPSSQAVEYIYGRFAETYFSDDTFAFLREWKPLQAALAHKPFNPEGEEYKEFMKKTLGKVDALSKKYPTFAYQNINKKQ